MRAFLFITFTLCCSFVSAQLGPFGPSPLGPSGISPGGPVGGIGGIGGFGGLSPGIGGITGIDPVTASLVGGAASNYQQSVASSPYSSTLTSNPAVGGVISQTLTSLGLGAVNPYVNMGLNYAGAGYGAAVNSFPRSTLSNPTVPLYSNYPSTSNSPLIGNVNPVSNSPFLIQQVSDPYIAEQMNRINYLQVSQPNVFQNQNSALPSQQPQQIQPFNQPLAQPNQQPQQQQPFTNQPQQIPNQSNMMYSQQSQQTPYPTQPQQQPQLQTQQPIQPRLNSLPSQLATSTTPLATTATPLANAPTRSDPPQWSPNYDLIQSIPLTLAGTMQQAQQPSMQNNPNQQPIPVAQPTYQQSIQQPIPQQQQQQPQQVIQPQQQQFPAQQNSNFQQMSPQIPQQGQNQLTNTANQQQPSPQFTQPIQSGQPLLNQLPLALFPSTSVVGSPEWVRANSNPSFANLPTVATWNGVGVNPQPQFSNPTATIGASNSVPLPVSQQQHQQISSLNHGNLPLGTPSFGASRGIVPNAGRIDVLPQMPQINTNNNAINANSNSFSASSAPLKEALTKKN